MLGSFSFQIWHDRWGKALPNAMDQISFASVLNDHGEWDISKLSLAFTADAIPHILGVKPLDPHASPDTCIWRWTEHRDFELKSAYYKWSQPDLEDLDPLWSHILRIQVPQRLHYFLWLTCRQKLMTNMERCKRALTDDTLCPLCRCVEESTLHTLKDCVNMRQILQQTIPQALSTTFFSTSMKDCLRQNLYSNIIFYNNIP
ncbi:hypothetical protein V6N12_045801 [Hibiscus sabdariffa]|uniref:Reverse transcriptase zinc-binding domain-containing protein n=1 Tax=Hibiscus sabdariffa TaxID=183260 RepID=A0ABR2G3Y2_9ROSI